MSQMVGGEVLARMLAAEGVEVVFGIVDGTYMGFFGSFEKHGIRMVSPRHETSAAHMAGAYARMTGKLGVCMASNGPGVANMVPGIICASVEGVPLLAIGTQRVRRSLQALRRGQSLADRFTSGDEGHVLTVLYGQRPADRERGVRSMQMRQRAFAEANIHGV